MPLLKIIRSCSDLSLLIGWHVQVMVLFLAIRELLAKLVS